MKKGFDKVTILILTALGVCAIVLFATFQITKSNDNTMPIIALICVFLFGIYFFYSKSRLLINKDSTVFPLFNSRIVKIVGLIMNLFLVALIVYACSQKRINIGLLCALGVVTFNSLIKTLFPYRSGNIIMIDKKGIYGPKMGYLEWNLIDSFKIESDIMFICFILKNKEHQILSYNENVNIGQLKYFLQENIKCLN